MANIEHLKVKIFADGADRSTMLELAARPLIQGLTTNPSLMRKAGITNYRAFAREILAEVRSKPVCLEVLSDEFREMERQAWEIAGWGDNVYVKIPVTNTRGEASYPLVRSLSDRGVKVNVTAVMTLQQVRNAASSFNPAVAGYVSVLAGRIADTGIDPVPLVTAAAHLLDATPRVQLIWASTRELLNIFHADGAGCHIITVTHELLGKLSLIGRDPEDCSLDTVKMLYRDAVAAGFSL
jgi:transaldolase